MASADGGALLVEMGVVSLSINDEDSSPVMETLEISYMIISIGSFPFQPKRAETTRGHTLTLKYVCIST